MAASADGSTLYVVAAAAGAADELHVKLTAHSGTSAPWLFSAVASKGSAT
jgi:hypothetical protein